MAVPRNRLSNARKNTRRAHHAKKGANTRNCPNCGAVSLPHRICQKCGHYAQRQIMTVEAE